MHVRTRIRKLLVAAVEERLPAVTVTDENPRQITTPSVQVLFAAEADAPTLRNDEPVRRVTSYSFVCRAIGDVVQDELDELADAVEDAVTGQLEGDGFRAWLSYQSSEQALDSQQDDRVGALTVTFDCEWSS